MTEVVKDAKNDELTRVKTLSSQRILDPFTPIVDSLLNHQCEVCGSTENLYIHLRDGDIRNSSLDNLTLLCYKCKLKEDRKIFRSILYDVLGTIYQKKEKEIVPSLLARERKSSEEKV